MGGGNLIYKLLIPHGDDPSEATCEERYVDGVKTARIVAMAIMDYEEDVGRVFIFKDEDKLTEIIYRLGMGYVSVSYTKDGPQKSYAVCPVDGNRELME